MDQYINELVDRRLQRGYDPEVTDVFNYLLQNKNPEDQLTLPDHYLNGFILVMSGSETTATSLTGVTYLLCKNPEKLAKVQAEIRSRFKDDSEITPKPINGLTYMLAVLNESARMFPASGFGLPRLVSSKCGQVVAGGWVPEKTR